MTAYEQGVRDGHLDKLLGYRSLYAWYASGLEPPGTFTYLYGVGYRAGNSKEA